MFELYFPKSPRDWVSILCFLMDQKVSSLLLFVFSLKLSQRVREIRKTWTNANLEVTNILTLTTVAMLLTSHASVRSVLVSGDMMWDWDLVIGWWLLTAATAQESHLLCGWAWSLSSLTPLALCRSLTSKQPRNTQWQCVRRQKLQLTPCPGPGEVTCHPTSHVTAQTRGSGLQHNSGKLSRGNRRCVLCVMCVLKIVVVQQRSLSSKFNWIFVLLEYR